MKRSSWDLKIKTGSTPLPSFEIQVGEDEQWTTVFEQVEEVLTRYAEKNPDVIATVYQYGTISFNFHEPAWSEFLIVADDTKSGSLSKVLSLIGQSTTGMRVQGIKSRYSDYVAPSSGTARFHIEQGMLWQPGDATYWLTNDPDEILNPEAIESKPADPEDEDKETNSTREQYPARFRAARSDASVRAICSQIEQVFGLPEGCVLLCKPDGKPIRADATIGTLRQRWEE